MTVKVQRKIQNAEIENECDSSQSHVQEPQGFLPTHPIPVAKGSAHHPSGGALGYSLSHFISPSLFRSSLS